MERKAASSIMLTLLLTGMLTLAFSIQPAEAQTYYYDFKITVTPESPNTLDEVRIKVSFDTASISYEVTFSSVSQIGNEFLVNIDIYVPRIVLWTIGYAEHTYNLGKLPAGSYTFIATVTVSGYGYGLYQYSKSFTVSTIASLQITTDKSVYSPGEDVKVTIKNIGDVYVEIGGYPCVEIYTYPDLEPVWPEIFAFLLWGLAPGESETWIWNQYNAYTESPAEPGMYTVKFIGSLDPSAEVIEAYFELSDAIEEWVPYVPLPNMVDLVFWTKNRTSYINVTITFSDAGYNVSDWGTVVKDGYEIWVDSKIWDWTGPAALVITIYKHTYDLGDLKEGNYTFTFKAWGIPIKSIILIRILGDLNCDGKVDIHDIATVAKLFGVIYPDPRYNPDCDITGPTTGVPDGKIDIRDIATVAKNFGKTVP